MASARPAQCKAHLPARGGPQGCFLQSHQAWVGRGDPNPSLLESSVTLTLLLCVLLRITIKLADAAGCAWGQSLIKHQGPGPWTRVCSPHPAICWWGVRTALQECTEPRPEGRGVGGHPAPAAPKPRSQGGAGDPAPARAAGLGLSHKHPALSFPYFPCGSISPTHSWRCPWPHPYLPPGPSPAAPHRCWEPGSPSLTEAASLWWQKADHTGPQMPGTSHICKDPAP